MIQMGSGRITEKERRKRRQRASLARFTLVVILVIALGFFIFYSIDNPEFFKDLFDRDRDEEERLTGTLTTSGSGDYRQENEAGQQLSGTGQSGEGEQEMAVTELPEEESADSETMTAGSTDSTSSANGNAETGGMVQQDEAVSGEDTGSANTGSATGLSLWQKILAFFTRRGQSQEPEEAYPSRITLNIYFAAAGEEKKLIAEERSIVAGSPGNALNNAVIELLKGPSKSYHFPVIPGGTGLKATKVNEGVAEIDLSKEFLENSLDTRILDEYIIYSIVNTVTEIPEVGGVVFLIEGKRIKVHGDMDLSIPLIRNPDLISDGEDQSGVEEDLQDEGTNSSGEEENLPEGEGEKEGDTLEGEGDAGLPDKEEDLQ